MPWTEELIRSGTPPVTNGIRLINSNHASAFARIELHLNPTKAEIDAVIIFKPAANHSEHSAQQLMLTLSLDKIFKKDDTDPFNRKPVTTFIPDISDEQLLLLQQVVAIDAEPGLFVRAKHKVQLEPSFAGSRADLGLGWGQNPRQDPEEEELDPDVARVNRLRLLQAESHRVREQRRERRIAAATSRLEDPKTQLETEAFKLAELELNAKLQSLQLNSEELDKLEKTLQCPITTHIIVDPVSIVIGTKNADGQIVGSMPVYFERAYLEEWCESATKTKIHPNGSYITVIKHPTLGTEFNLETFKSLIKPAPEYLRLRDKLIQDLAKKKQPPTKPTQSSKAKNN